MGTSINRNKVRPNIPLIPDWVSEDSPQSDEPSGEEKENGNPKSNDEGDNPEEEQPNPPPNRFNQSQRGFSKVVKTDGNNRGALNRVLKNYVRSAGGGARNMARRMQRSSGAAIKFGTVLTDIQRNGLQAQLRQLNLEQYANRPAIEVLGAIMDVVCGVGALLDDAITKQAYASTIIRIDEENPGLDLDNLNSAQVSHMLALFLEETIVYRLISDIGRSLTVKTSDVEKSRQTEEDLYQIVHGLVYSTIIPQLNGALSDIQRLEQEMEGIYQIAFTSILGQ